MYPLFSLIEKLETETTAKQTNLETLRREKVELENTLEQEQEALVNKLWKRMDQLETEKRTLQSRMDPPEDPTSAPSSLPGPPTGPPLIVPPPSLEHFASKTSNSNGDTATNLANHIRVLKAETARLKHQLSHAKVEHERKMAEFVRFVYSFICLHYLFTFTKFVYIFREEKEIKEENLRLQRRLQLEMERREALCRYVLRKLFSPKISRIFFIYLGFTIDLMNFISQFQFHKNFIGFQKKYL